MANIKIEVTKDEHVYTMTLRNPKFDELSLAYNAMFSGLTTNGIPDLPKAGKRLIDTCIIEAETDKEFFTVEMGDRLMLSAALQAATLVEVFDAELKKN